MLKSITATVLIRFFIAEEDAAAASEEAAAASEEEAAALHVHFALAGLF